MSLKIDVKKLLTEEEVTLTWVAEELSKIKGETVTQPNLSQKLARGTLKYDDLKLICKILGYDLRFVKVRRD